VKLKGYDEIQSTQVNFFDIEQAYDVGSMTSSTSKELYHIAWVG
jgi:hypothetical protein